MGDGGWGFGRIVVNELYLSFFFSFLLLFFDISFISSGKKFGLPYLNKATAAARAALPIPNRAWDNFVCPNKAANTWDL